MLKAKLKKLSNIAIFEPIDQNKEYLVSLVCSPDGIFTPSRDGEEETEPTYHLSVVRVADIMPVGGKPVKFKEAKSESKVLRDLIYLLGKQQNVTDDEAFYKKIMSQLQDIIRKKLT